jgi:hypothetical protein
MSGSKLEEFSSNCNNPFALAQLLWQGFCRFALQNNRQRQSDMLQGVANFTKIFLVCFNY